MGSLEDRLRKLEKRLILDPTVDEYLDASHRQGARALHTLVERLEEGGFDGGCLFTEGDQLMLAEDTPEQQERDRETVEAWHRSQGLDRTTDAEGARERLLAKLGCSGR